MIRIGITVCIIKMSIGATKINETGESLRQIANQMEDSITEIGGQIDQFKV